MKKNDVIYASGLNNIEIGQLVQDHLTGYKNIILTDFSRFDFT